MTWQWVVVIIAVLLAVISIISIFYGKKKELTQSEIEDRMDPNG